MSVNPTTRLRNNRREVFCQLYAGDCWANATAACLGAGYSPKKSHTASVAASRLLTFDDVTARVGALRDEAHRRMAVDRLLLLERELGVLNDPATPPDVVLRAAAQIRKAMGWGTPERHVHKLRGTMECRQSMPHLDAEALGNLKEMAQLCVARCREVMESRQEVREMARPV